MSGEIHLHMHTLNNKLCPLEFYMRPDLREYDRGCSIEQFEFQGFPESASQQGCPARVSRRLGGMIN